MRKQHAGQFRKKSKYTTEDIQYINHPLLMACQAHAMGIREDTLLSAILLHDVVEDAGLTAEELPFGEEVRTKLVEYIEETAEYVLPLTDVLKNDYSKYSDAAFLVKYQIISILETIKYLIVD